MLPSNRGEKPTQSVLRGRGKTIYRFETKREATNWFKESRKRKGHSPHGGIRGKGGGEKDNILAKKGKKVWCVFGEENISGGHVTLFPHRGKRPIIFPRKTLPFRKVKNYCGVWREKYRIHHRWRSILKRKSQYLLQGRGGESRQSKREDDSFSCPPREKRRRREIIGMERGRGKNSAEVMKPANHHPEEGRGGGGPPSLFL